MGGDLHMMPWQIDMLDAMQTYNLSKDAATDVVILDWLARGDPKAFYDFVLIGHQPSSRVLQALSFMMMRGDPDCDFDPAKTTDPDLAAAMPFSLLIKGKKAGRRVSASNRTRDSRVALEVAREMDRGVSYDGAVATVHEWLKGLGIEVCAQTIRDAYDARASLYGKQ